MATAVYPPMVSEVDGFCRSYRSLSKAPNPRLDSLSQGCRSIGGDNGPPPESIDSGFDTERRTILNGNIARRDQKSCIADDLWLDSPMRESIQLQADGTGAACIRPAPRIVRSKRVVLGVPIDFNHGKR